MAVQLTFEMHFRLHAGFHSTGDRTELWTDKALALDWHEQKKPILPASSLKGWLRESAERALRGLGHRVCDSSQPATLCGQCLVCELFGHPRQRSPLRFEDGVLANALTAPRTHVSLSRYRRTAYEERLFAMEVAWETRLVAKGEGFFPSPDKACQAAALLWLAAQMGVAVGAARSRGLGWLTLEKFVAYCDDAPITKEQLHRCVNAFKAVG